MPRLTINASFAIKEMPKGQPGYRGGSFSFARDHGVSMSSMLMMVCNEIIRHYEVFTPDETMIAEFNAFRDRVNKIAAERS